jgi:hypothetical protein
VTFAGFTASKENRSVADVAIPSTTEAEGQTPAPPRRRRWLRITGIVVLVAAVALGVAAEYLARHAEPLLRAAVVDTLSAKCQSPVQLDSLTVSLVQGIEVHGAGLRILYLAGPSQPYLEQVHAEQNHQPVPPMLSVDSFRFHLSLDDLRRRQARIARVEVQGVALHIPPHSVKGAFEPAAPTAAKKPRFRLEIGRIECRNMELYLETDRPGKDALRFDIHSLDLDGIGAGRPIAFTADVINPHPRGDVHAVGRLGPWRSQEPRATPIDGQFRFEHADLNTIKGIGGMLTATGSFSGQLGRLAVQASNDVPDFSVDISGHPEHLTANVHATVDGTTGDTYLDEVHAKLGSSTFTTQGAVVRAHMPDNTEGHDISLAVQMAHGRIEDLLALSMKTLPPVMRGTVAMQTKLHIPPGKERVSQKIQLAGDLTIQGVEFSSAKLQDRVDALSLRAQGKPQEVKLAGSDGKAEVASRMAVQFSLAHQLMTVPALRYEVPGARIAMDGVYSLDGNLFEFKGHVRTDATASQMVTGWRSVLLKAVDPFLKKNGAGVELPISVSGAKGDFRFGLAMHDVDESTAAMAADLKARRQASHPRR